MADSDEDNPRPSLSLSLSHSPSSSPSPSPAPNHDADLSEETQDFRFLTSLTSTTNTTTFSSSTSTSIPPSAATPAIPRRGEKDFEPNPTKSQEKALMASRQAMHDALARERVHAGEGKGWVVGYYVGAREEGEGEGEGDGRRRGFGGREKAREKFGRCVVRVDQPRGTHFRTMGRSDGENRIWLLPEEALYLVERGSLDVRWGVPEEKEEGAIDGSGGGKLGEGNENGEVEGMGKRGDRSDEDHDQDEDEQEQEQEQQGEPSLSDLPMSLQGGYTTFISEDDLTLARYTVFAGLRRSGYTVIRAPTWDNTQPVSSTTPNATVSQPSTVLQPNTSLSDTHNRPSSVWFNLRNLFARLFRFFFRIDLASSRRVGACASLGPLVAPGLYRSYADIYRALTMIPFHDPLSRPSPPPRPSTTTASQPNSPNPSSTQTIPPFRPTYHVYKPNTPFRKTSPPSPDFYLAVIDARSHPSIPNLAEIGTLLEEMPLNDPMEDEKLKKGRPEMRLKAGTRSCVLAVVDGGVVSFLRVAETGSGREKIFEGKAARGGGKKGVWRGRGRGGRGRGRGG